MRSNDRIIPLVEGVKPRKIKKGPPPEDSEVEIDDAITREVARGNGCGASSVDRNMRIAKTVETP